MRFIETAGKSVEDAIRAGLKELGCDITDVTCDVLDHGSPGLFGMFGRLAKVRLTVKEQETDDFASIGLSALKEAESKPKAESKPAPKAEPKAEVKAEAKPEVKPETKAEPKAEKPASKTEKPKTESKPRAEKPKAESKPRSEAKAKPAPKAEEPELPLIPRTPEEYSDNAKAAHNFLETVTKGMGVDVEIAISENEKHLCAEMTGDALGILIGRRGDTLDALQYLTSLVVNKKKSEYVRVSLESEHYRAKREDALVKLAERMAYKAQKSGRRVALEPMNPYERRILHSALQNHPAVTTHSEGEEPYRRVIITLK